MIIIASKDKALAKKLKSDLKKQGQDTRIIDVKNSGFMASFYAPEVTAVIADDHFDCFPVNGVVDALNSLAMRIPVVVLSGAGPEKSHHNSDAHEFHDSITVVDPSCYDELVTTAGILKGFEVNQGVKARCKSIPYYNPQIPISMLKDFGGLGILTIDASGFNKISVEYGSDVYGKVKDVFDDILFNLWGQPGSFRDTDVICRRSLTSNIYVIFMNRSRDTGALPHPGALEQVADRISKSIHGALWDELFAPRNKRRIPDCIESMPLVGVGFFGVLNNPCIDIQEILNSGLEASRQMASSQQRRGKERQRELMQTLIQSTDLLMPYYQGVFNLQAIDKEMVDEVVSSKSIAPIRDAIFGFESLIRVNQQAAEDGDNFDNGIEARYLRPDVLFSLAKYTKVALELDQACMRHAANGAGDLPGVLMINVLPRNLYYIDRLKATFARTKSLMFEISESEAISNFELMMETRDHLEAHNMGIAADDFGKGYSSLERIIRIKPHVIKFDRGMIQEIDKDPVKQAYVKGLVEAAKILSTTILAEGVETWEEAAVLKGMGVELIQGFLLHRPEKYQSIMEQIEEEDLAALNPVA